MEEGGFYSLLVCLPLPLSLQSCLKDEKEADVCFGLVTRAKMSPSCSPDRIPKGWLWKTLWDPTTSGCPGIVSVSLHPPRVHWFTRELGAVRLASPNVL